MLYDVGRPHSSLQKVGGLARLQPSLLTHNLAQNFVLAQKVLLSIQRHKEAVKLYEGLQERSHTI
jgi:hypothetical protein